MRTNSISSVSASTTVAVIAEYLKSRGKVIFYNPSIKCPATQLKLPSSPFYMIYCQKLQQGHITSRTCTFNYPIGGVVRKHLHLESVSPSLSLSTPGRFVLMVVLSLSLLYILLVHLFIALETQAKSIVLSIWMTVKSHFYHIWILGDLGRAVNG